MLKTMGIYKIKNLINNKVYIGGSTDVHQRFRRQKHELKNNKHWLEIFQIDWNRYGEINFEFTIIERVNDKNILLEREQYWSDKFLSYKGKHGYNKRTIVSCNKNVTLTESARLKISKKLKGKLVGNKNPMHKSNHVYSEETREKLRKANGGVNNNMYGKGFLLQGQKNGRAKLNNEDVVEILKLINSGCTGKEIAKNFNVKPTAISRIKNRTSWKNIVLN